LVDQDAIQFFKWDYNVHFVLTFVLAVGLTFMFVAEAALIALVYGPVWHRSMRSV